MNTTTTVKGSTITVGEDVGTDIATAAFNSAQSLWDVAEAYGRGTAAIYAAADAEWNGEGAAPSIGLSDENIANALSAAAMRSAVGHDENALALVNPNTAKRYVRLVRVTSEDERDALRNAPKPMAPLTISVRFGTLLADDEKRSIVLRELVLKTRKSADAIILVAKGDASAKDAPKVAKAAKAAKDAKVAKAAEVKSGAMDILRHAVAEDDAEAEALKSDDVIVKAAQIVSSGTVAKSYDDRKRDALRFIAEAIETDDTDTVSAILDLIGETTATDHFLANA